MGHQGDIIIVAEVEWAKSDGREEWCGWWLGREEVGWGLGKWTSGRRHDANGNEIRQDRKVRGQVRVMDEQVGEGKQLEEEEE